MDQLVSIVIPTYNHARFLDEALKSVVGQTYSNWEALVVDNHSQDDTDAVVSSFGDKRIRLFKIHNRGIIAASRNLGIKNAKGEWVAFLDSDDYWLPQKLEQCLRHLDGRFDLVCHGERWFGDGRDRVVYYGPDSRGTYEKLLFSGNCISTSAVVVARKCLDEAGGFREDAEIVTAEDYDLWLRLAQQGARIGFLSELLGIYRLHSGNQSGAVVRNMNAVLSVVRHHFVHTGSPRYRIRRREALVYYSGARGLQDAGKHGEAWSLFLKALSLWPVEPKFYAAMLLNALRQRIG